MLTSSTNDHSAARALVHTYVPALMAEAFKEAHVALLEGEVPVGCVLVHQDLNVQLAQIIMRQHNTAPSQGQCVQYNSHARDNTHTRQDADDALQKAIETSKCLFRGRNATNKRRHALAHAEFVALEALTASSFMKASVSAQPLSQFVLYVTVEPCIMCASMLLYNCVGYVFFGTGNPRFGGNGTVLALHDGARNRYCEGETTTATAAAAESGSDHRRWCGYGSEGGFRADDAIALLQEFYERENPNAPGHKRRRKAGEE